MRVDLGLACKQLVFCFVPTVEDAGNPAPIPVVSSQCRLRLQIMIPFDRVLPFTYQLAIDVVREILTEHYHKREKPLKSEHLLEFLRFCLKTYFTFGGQRYEEIKGTPVDSSLSGLIAEVVLQRIEHFVFTKYQPKFWALYVDGTFIIVKTSDIEHLKELLNSIPRDEIEVLEKSLSLPTTLSSKMLGQWRVYDLLLHRYKAQIQCALRTVAFAAFTYMRLFAVIGSCKAGTGKLVFCVRCVLLDLIVHA
ncbi:unnamed protein product [Dibothriocephalus latus]|uniref:Reverse transcriptase domain-containing protein n=1 Tax=Dibothriocephalus latus TaxID=60516 RepID=A0A3P7LSF8_DIBLA|nr:unnamed protein product [Dibothriocephalus latus]